MFSVDWPFISNKMASDWLNAAPLDAADKSRIFGQNAVALLKL
jgi:predicted TIM-barrel fold metal-dependent hydrolase